MQLITLPTVRLQPAWVNIPKRRQQEISLTFLNSLGGAAIPISSLKYWFHEKPFFLEFFLATSESSSTLIQASLASALPSSPVDLLFLPFSAIFRPPGGNPSRPEIHCRLKHITMIPTAKYLPICNILYRYTIVCTPLFYSYQSLNS